MRSIPGPFALLATAWKFSRKHPVLLHVFCWLFILVPLALDVAATGMLSLAPHTADGVMIAWPPAAPVFGVIVLGIAAFLVAAWADACVLLVGRRMTVSTAGRARTSFLLLLRQTRGSALRLIGGGIIRGCTVLLLQIPAILYGLLVLWRLDLLPTAAPKIADPELMLSQLSAAIVARIGAFPLFVILLTGTMFIIPSIIYAIRSSLYAPALLQGKRSIRESLRRSSMVIRPHVWRVTWSLLILLTMLLLLPATIIGMIIESAGPSPLREIEFLVGLIGTALMGFCWILFLLSLSALYGALSKGRPKEIVD